VISIRNKRDNLDSLLGMTIKNKVGGTGCNSRNTIYMKKTELAILDAIQGASVKKRKLGASARPQADRAEAGSRNSSVDEYS
jgi:hypothetical protein